MPDEPSVSLLFRTEGLRQHYFDTLYSNVARFLSLTHHSSPPKIQPIVASPSVFDREDPGSLLKGLPPSRTKGNPAKGPSSASGVALPGTAVRPFRSRGESNGKAMLHGIVEAAASVASPRRPPTPPRPRPQSQTPLPAPNSVRHDDAVSDGLVADVQDASAAETLVEFMYATKAKDPSLRQDLNPLPAAAPIKVTRGDQEIRPQKSGREAKADPDLTPSLAEPPRGKSLVKVKAFVSRAAAQSDEEDGKDGGTAEGDCLDPPDLDGAGERPVGKGKGDIPRGKPALVLNRKLVRKRTSARTVRSPARFSEELMVQTEWKGKSNRAAYFGDDCSRKPSAESSSTESLLDESEEEVAQRGRHGQHSNVATFNEGREKVGQTRSRKRGRPPKNSIKEMDPEVTPTKEKNEFPRRSSRARRTPHNYNEDESSEDLEHPFPPKLRDSKSNATQRNDIKNPSSHSILESVVSPPSTGGCRKGRFTCGCCEACLRPDCGECIMCLDKPKFGGPHTKKQRCLLRQPCPQFSTLNKIQNSPSPSATNFASSMSRVNRHTSPKTQKTGRSDSPLDDTKQSDAKRTNCTSHVARATSQDLANPSAPVPKSRPSRIRISRRTAQRIKITEQPDLPSAVTADASCQRSDGALSDVKEDVMSSAANSSQCSGRAGEGPSCLGSTLAEALDMDIGRTCDDGEDMKKPQFLESAEPLPRFPRTGLCTWKFDEVSRVLLADFRQSNGEVQIHRIDEEFLLKIMQRTDLTTVIEGLVDGLDPSKWDLGYISGCVGDEYYHKVRHFRRKAPNNTGGQLGKSTTVPEAEQLKGVKLKKTDAGNQKEDLKLYVTHEEMDVCVSIRVSDYMRYLELRSSAMARITQSQSVAGLDPITDSFGSLNTFDSINKTDARKDEHSDNSDKIIDDDDLFHFVGHDGKPRSVNAIDDVLYLIDYDMAKLLPAVYDDFKHSFKLPDFMPGGAHCMMHSVNAGGRPFMGPNLYITPPASFTHFHQDGHGTVDSGHVCLSGYNEVVMLRRMPEAHKRKALNLLHGAEDLNYDALYGMPHGDGQGKKPMWPSLKGGYL